MSKRIYQDDWNLNDVLEVLESGKNPLLRVGAGVLYLSELALVRISQHRVLSSTDKKIFILIKDKYLNFDSGHDEFIDRHLSILEGKLQ